MGIEVKTENGVCQVRIEGELTIYTTGEYREVLLDPYDTRQGMNLDLADVTEVDVSGVQLLLALKKRLEEMALCLRLHNPSEIVLEALKLMNLAETFGDEVGGAVR